MLDRLHPDSLDDVAGSQALLDDLMILRSRLGFVDRARLYVGNVLLGVAFVVLPTDFVTVVANNMGEIQ